MTNKRFACHFITLLALTALAIVPANAFSGRAGAVSKSGFLRAHNAASIAGSQIEITEIKNAGVSAAKETHSIVQISWAMQGAPDMKISSFELLLEVTYADGFVEKSSAKAPGSARTTRFEVATLHRFANQPAAEMKSFKVSVTANSSETTTKQISL